MNKTKTILAIDILAQLCLAAVAWRYADEWMLPFFYFQYAFLAYYIASLSVGYGLRAKIGAALAAAGLLALTIMTGYLRWQMGNLYYHVLFVPATFMKVDVVFAAGYILLTLAAWARVKEK